MSSSNFEKFMTPGSPESIWDVIGAVAIAVGFIILAVVLI